VTIRDWLIDKLQPGPKRQRRRHWQAADRNRITRGWVDGLLSADAELWDSLPTLRGRSRQLVRDNPHAAAAARVWVDNVVGPNGLTLHPLVTRGDQSLDSEANAEIRRFWRAWGTRSVCTVDRRHSWFDVERLAVRSEFVDGEFLAIERTGRGVNEFGYALQLLDPDQLDASFNRTATKGRNEIRMGVEVTEWGEAVAYHLWPGHPQDMVARGRERMIVPAAQVLHYFQALRPGQTRGIPRLAPVMSRLKMLDRYSEAELLAAAVGACSSVHYEQDEHSELDEDDGDPAGEIPVELEPAMARLLPKGVKAVFNKAEHPATAYGPFVDVEHHAVGAGLGIAHSTLTGNLNGANYGSLRDGTIKERDVYRVEHRRLPEHFHSRVFRAALKNGVLYDAVEIKGSDWRRYALHAFAGRGWAWVDPWKDLKAAELELALRLTTRSRLALENGRSFEELLQEWDQDTELAKAWGVTLNDPMPTGSAKAAAVVEDAEDDDEEKETTDDDDSD
jgi:lambda family phage portal protein